METYLLKSTAAMTHFLLLISSLICCAQESWIVVSNTNAPKARTLHSAVWTGNRMIVWGGGSGNVPFFKTGGVYNASENTWVLFRLRMLLKHREHLQLYGRETEWLSGAGHNTPSSPLKSGGIYDPETDTRESMTNHNRLEPRSNHTAGWTGRWL